MKMRRQSPEGLAGKLFLGGLFVSLIGGIVIPSFFQPKKPEKKIRLEQALATLDILRECRLRQFKPGKLPYETPELKQELESIDNPANPELYRRAIKLVKSHAVILRESPEVRKYNKVENFQINCARVLFYGGLVFSIFSSCIAETLTSLYSCFRRKEEDTNPQI